MIGIALALSLMAIWMVMNQRSRQISIEFIAPTWRRLAHKHGWRFIDGTLGVDSRLEGELEGYRFTARARVEDGQVLLVIPLLNPSAEGEQLEASVSSFASTELMKALRALVAEAKEREMAHTEGWSQLATQHGLILSVRLGMRTLRGDIGGRSVRIGTQAAPVETVIRVQIGAPWPRSVLIRAREAGAEASVSTGNPILDGLVTVTGEVTPAAHAALRDPRVAEDLIAVLHPYPRSSVVGGHVQMHCPGQLKDELSDRVADAIALASRLQSVAGS